ncbi:MAG: class I SAM-dependent methyltransferase [Actinobacteria bacterium]|nr:class I SAM-dependent methyltransferase [Actinomycetota bacterium]MBM3712129.1 class I SAM-dependent methyltransferase [Actinomycetota bacterium]
MDGSEQEEKYIKNLKDKVIKEAKIISISEPSDKKATDLYQDRQNKNIYDLLCAAEQNASIGADLFLFENRSFLKRIIYRWVVRFLFKILRVITVNQNRYNLAVLKILQTSIDADFNLALLAANDRTQFNTRLTDNEVKIKNLDNRIYYLEKNIDFLKNSFMQLNQEVDAIFSDRGRNYAKRAGKKELQGITKKFNRNLDSLYVFLEDNLRGSRTDIMDRLKIYLPILEKANIGSEDLPVLDIGCGRGEWLELLREKNLNASGIDINKVMVKICRDLKLNVTEEEVFSYLKTVKDGSIGAVTGFHLIEHYEFDFLVELFKELYRVLKPGGLVIFETPNPDNILVGSCTFYLDPTHNKPLPSLLAKLLLEAHGFGNVSIINLHPNKLFSKIKESGSEHHRMFNEYFFGPQDYAIIGYKV